MIEALGLVAAVAGLAIGSLSVLREWLSRSHRLETRLQIDGEEVDLRNPEEALKRLRRILSEKREHPRVAVVYESSDVDTAKGLAEDLRHAGVQVWLAAEQLKVGDSIPDAIAEAIDESDWVIVLVPTDGARGKWWRAELELARRAEDRRDRPLLLPVVQGEGAVPGFLAERVHVNLAPDYDAAVQRLVSAMRDRTRGHS